MAKDGRRLKRDVSWLETGGLLVLVGLFQTWAAGHYSVFDDEAFSCLRYTLPPGEMVSALWHGAEPDPPLYYLMQNLWVHWFGVGPLGLRSLSIVLFLAGLVALRAAARNWYGETMARWTLWIAALHPAHLFFGFAGRWYAAMFCATAVVLYVTSCIERAASAGRPSRGWWMAWGVAAAVACYVNYFGPVVVGLIWLMMLRGRETNAAPSAGEDARRYADGRSGGGPIHLRRYGAGRYLAAAVAVAMYSPWAPAFWRQVGTFPSVGGPWQESAASLARTLAALAAGNLASVRAWWVWLPLAAAFAALVVTALRHWQMVRRPAMVALGCLLAGTLTRVMIDKYVLAFSGIVCLAAVRAVTMSHAARERLLPRVVLVGLAIGWLGCGVNLVTQKNWSSLRWLDPFEDVVMANLGAADAPAVGDWVVTHPAARYYVAMAQAKTPGVWRVDAAKWRACIEQRGPMRPEQMLERLKDVGPERVLTIRTAGFADDADWARLEEALGEKYTLERERGYLADPDAALKDRIDPRYAHPAWRIAVQIWKR